MNPRSLYVYGAGGHGKVVADVCRAAGLEPSGFIDDAIADDPRWVLDLPIWGNAIWLRSRAKQQRVAVVLGLGDNSVRCRVAAELHGWGIEFPVAVHPRAVVAPSASLGPGTVIMAGAVVNPDSQLGEGVIINTGAVVEHDNRIGPFAHLSANAATGGNVTVGAESHLGLGAVVLPGVCIGRQTVVGAGAVVLRDLPDRVIAAGVPAHILRRLDAPSNVG